MKLQGTMPMYFNGAKISDKLYKMLRDHQAAAALASLDSGLCQSPKLASCEFRPREPAPTLSAPWTLCRQEGGRRSC